jgi:hypothetical protein
MNSLTVIKKWICKRIEEPYRTNEYCKALRDVLEVIEKEQSLYIEGLVKEMNV